MTLTTNTTDNPSPSGTRLAEDGSRALFGRAVALAGSVMADVRPDQLDDPTPCTEYDVRALLGHLMTVLHRVAALGRGEGPFALPDVRVADDGWVEALVVCVGREHAYFQVRRAFSRSYNRQSGADGTIEALSMISRAEVIDGNGRLTSEARPARSSSRHVAGGLRQKAGAAVFCALRVHLCGGP